MVERGKEPPLTLHFRGFHLGHMFASWRIWPSKACQWVQACREGGVLKVSLWPPNGFIHHLAVHFKFFTVCRWSTSLSAIENHHCSNKFGYNYAPSGSVRYTHLSSLSHCNKCVTKLLFSQALASSPVESPPKCIFVKLWVTTTSEPKLDTAVFCICKCCNNRWTVIGSDR